MCLHTSAWGSRSVGLGGAGDSAFLRSPQVMLADPSEEAGRGGGGERAIPQPAGRAGPAGRAQHLQGTDGAVGAPPPVLLRLPVLIYRPLPLFEGALGRKHVGGSTLSGMENIRLVQGGVRAQVLLLQAAFPGCPAHSTHPSFSLTTPSVHGSHVFLPRPKVHQQKPPFSPFPRRAQRRVWSHWGLGGDLQTWEVGACPGSWGHVR